MAHPAQSIEEKRRVRPEQSAWLMLLVFFLFFCVIVAVGGYAGWRYYNFAMTPQEGLLRVHVNAGVTFQARGEARTVSLDRSLNPCSRGTDICKPIARGDRVQARPEAGYGPVASIVLPDQSQIDMWAHPLGADVMLENYQVTRWTRRRQEVSFRQEVGYARYDVKDGQPYDEVTYTVEITDGVRVALNRPGSYSINVFRAQPGQPPAQTASGAPMLVEVAVRTGSAEVQGLHGSATIRPSEKVQVDLAGTVGEPIPATWELIDDGDFTEYAAQGNYGPGSSTWEQYQSPSPGITPGEENGQFTVEKKCRPQTPDFCESPDDQVNVGQFRREGDQTRLFITGIQQDLDADVSEYTSLRLSGWVRVTKQSVKGSGTAGSECPIMIQLVYKETSPTDEERRRYFCVYIPEDGADAAPQDAGEIKYRPVPQFEWWYLRVELRKDPLIKQARYLQTLRIEARGHDYVSEISGISLVGAQ